MTDVRPIVNGKVQTLSGRWILAPNGIRTGSSRKAANDFKKLEHWLVDRFIEEAESKGDEWNLNLTAKCLKPGKLTQSDKDVVNIYLFGETHPVFHEREDK